MKKYILDRLAFFISVLSSPYLTIAGFGLWDISVYSTTNREFFQRSALFLCFIIAIPLLYTIAAVKAGLITDLHVMLRGQRGGPFFVALLGALLLGEIYHLQDTPRVLEVLALTIAVAGFIFLMISRYWKISMHTSSLAGSIATAAMTINPRAWWLLLTVPVVMWARVYRRRHDLLEGAIAFLIILIITMVIWLVFMG